VRDQSKGREMKMLKKKECRFAFACLLSGFVLWGVLDDCALAREKGHIPVKANLYSVCFVDESHGWACGIRGTVYRTSDGGLNWGLHRADTNWPLLSVSFFDREVGWVVGKGGIIFHSVDGGKSWQEQTSPKKKHLFAVKAVSRKKCWAAGDWGTIVHTQDGGKHWTDRTYEKDMIFNAIDFQGEDEGWIAGEFGAVLHTADGGTTWSEFATGVDGSLFGVSFTSPLEGLAVGLSGVILRTGDGGRSWDKVGPQPPEDDRSLYEVRLNGQLAVAAGDAGKIMTSRDCGRTWRPIPLPLDMNLFWFRGVSVNKSKGVVVGAQSLVVITNDDQMKILGFVPRVLPPQPAQ
jgi:photosystem II stability/assembly factor-like uncharacterized protein